MSRYNTPLNRIVFTVAVTLAVAGVVFFLLFYLPEVLWWSRHKDITLISACHGTSLALEDFKEKRGGYPTAMSDDPTLSFRAQAIGDSCRMLGHPVGELQLMSVRAAGRSTAPRAVGIVKDEAGKVIVAFYEGGTVGVSRSVLTRPLTSIPSWMIALP